MTAPAEDAPERERNAWGRVIRVDCRSVPPKQAREWLKQYGAVIDVMVARMSKALPYAAGLEVDDLRSIGRYAVIEACLTYDPTRPASLRTWVGTVVRWRMAATVEMSERDAREIVDHAGAARRQETNAVDDFEARMEHTETLRQIGSAFADLPRRTRVVVLQRLAGRPSTEIAKMLGISTVLELRIYNEAKDRLREALAALEADEDSAPA